MRLFFIVRFMFLLVLLATGKNSWAQNIKVVNKRKIYWEQVINDSNYKMVELRSMIPLIIYDLRYATKNNFTGHKLYAQSKTTYLRLPAARALDSVQKYFLEAGYGLKIFDAYRPYSVTKKMWELIKDERYVANPAKGSGHNRGLAVDLTLVDLILKKDIDMGTGFDNFTDSAHHDFQKLPGDVLFHRKFLKEAMERFGFKALDTEWWHYSWPNDRNYDVLDLDFKDLGK